MKAKQSSIRSPAASTQGTLVAAGLTPSDAPPNLLGCLEETTRKAVLASGRPRLYAAGEIVFRQGAPHEGIHLIEDGLVRSFYLSEEGRELTLGFWSTGHYVGAPQMFGGGRHAWTSAAVVATRCLWLPGPQLRKLSLERPDLALALLDALVHKSQCYCAVLQLLATHSMRVRLARLLAMLAAREGAADIGLSHGQLASMIGSTRQWVSRTLARFADEGLIEKRIDGQVQVLRPEELAALG